MEQEELPEITYADLYSYEFPHLPLNHRAQMVWELAGKEISVREVEGHYYKLFTVKTKVDQFYVEEKWTKDMKTLKDITLVNSPVILEKYTWYFKVKDLFKGFLWSLWSVL